VLADAFGDVILVTGDVFGAGCKMLEDVVVGEEEVFYFCCVCVELDPLDD